MESSARDSGSCGDRGGNGSVGVLCMVFSVSFIEGVEIAGGPTVVKGTPAQGPVASRPLTTVVSTTGESHTAPQRKSILISDYSSMPGRLIKTKPRRLSKSLIGFGR